MNKKQERLQKRLDYIQDFMDSATFRTFHPTCQALLVNEELRAKLELSENQLNN